MRGRRRYPFAVTKDTKRTARRRWEQLAALVVLRIHPHVVVLPGLPGFPFLVLSLHARRDRQGTEGRDPEDDRSCRRGEGETADEPASESRVGDEEDGDDRERNGTCDSPGNPAHRWGCSYCDQKSYAAKIIHANLSDTVRLVRERSHRGA